MSKNSVIQAAKGDTVKVHYTGKLTDDTLFDSSQDREPLQFKIGDGNIIPGFEEAIIGMKSGDSKTVTIPSQQAYGEFRQELLLEVKNEHLPADLKPEIGQRLTMQLRDQQQAMVTVVKINPTSITLDANHPLAGQDLIFDLELVEIL